MNILVIENEEFLAENLCQYLKQIENLNLEYATSARQALQLLSQQRFDLLISDLWMSDTKSEDWLWQVANINPGQKLIIISSYPVPQQIGSSSGLNIIGYFEKPFDVHELGRTINRLIAETSEAKIND
ncbi:MAG: response regulator [candidate division KSB1 bacterium]|nr:response regulator [candidate division KSB1 bacterium]